MLSPDEQAVVDQSVVAVGRRLRSLSLHLTGTSQPQEGIEEAIQETKECLAELQKLVNTPVVGVTRRVQEV